MKRRGRKTGERRLVPRRPPPGTRQPKRKEESLPSCAVSCVLSEGKGGGGHHPLKLKAARHAAHTASAPACAQPLCPAPLGPKGGRGWLERGGLRMGGAAGTTQPSRKSEGPRSAFSPRTRPRGAAGRAGLPRLQPASGKGPLPCSPYRSTGCDPRKTLWAPEAGSRGSSRSPGCTRRHSGCASPPPGACQARSLLGRQQSGVSGGCGQERLQARLPCTARCQDPARMPPDFPRGRLEWARRTMA